MKKKFDKKKKQQQQREIPIESGTNGNCNNGFCIDRAEAQRMSEQRKKLYIFH